MADNLAVTPGTGATIALEEITGVKFQQIKLIDPTVGSTTPIGTTGNPLKVSAASLPLPTGASTEATLAGVLTTSDFDTKTGSLTETAPATDTASSGLNGRLQRIAQRLSSMIALLPTALGGGGGLKIDGSGTALPVSQSGTWTVQPGNTANTTAWKVDGSAVTQPVSGTITASNTTGNIASGSADSGNPVKAGGKYNLTPPTFADGNRGDLQLDANGLLKVNVIAGSGSGSGTSSGFNSAFPANGTAIGASDGTNMKALNVDASGFLKVNVAAGSGGNGAASNTGSAVPTQADYNGVNVAGTLRGQTAVNPSGTVYAAQSDIASVAGTTVDSNSGNKSAGTLRVVLATDQPALTNKLLVTPDSVALPANQSVNVNQINSVTPLMGSGNTGTGSLRVTIVTDQPALTNKLLVTPDSVALPANQSVNISQMNGVTVSMNAGAAGTGVQRVTLASDDPAVATLGAISGAKVITDANGTIQQYLRGLIYQLITLGASFFSEAASPSGGYSKVSYAAQTTTVRTVATGQRKLGGYYVYNPNATVAYVQLFDVATGTTVTLGTTVPDVFLGIPPTSAANLLDGTGIDFALGIKMACTTTATGSTAPGTGLDVNLFHK